MSAPVSAQDGRRAELAAGLRRVRARVDAACAAAGRDRAEVTLIVVTKFFPAADVGLLAELGVRDVGENRHQEAEAKADQVRDLDLAWHFIGGLQSNKAAAVPAYAAMVHSVDRPKLVAPLDRGAGERGAVLPVLLQVSLDPPERAASVASSAAGSGGRAGVDPADLPGLAERVAAAEHLRLAGLMAVAPRDVDPVAAFARLAEVRADLLADHPDADLLSAGMSGDLEAAVAVGATHVRVGSAVLGSRPPVR